MDPQTLFWALGVIRDGYQNIYEKMNFSIFSNSKIFRGRELDLCRKSSVWEHRIIIGNPLVTLAAEYPVLMHENASRPRKIFELENFGKYIFP